MPTAALLLVASSAIGAGAESIEFAGACAQRAANIVKHSTIHTSTSWEAIDVDPGLFEWFIDHPSATAALWKELGLQVGDVELLKDGWRSRDPDGVTLEFHRIHQSNGLRGYYCKATAPTGAIPRTVTAEFVLLHRLSAAADSDGRQPVDQLEAWVSAEGAALRVIMKLAKGTATNFVVRSLRETKLYFTLAAKIAERRPQWATTTLQKRPGGLAPAEVAQFEQHLKRAASMRSTTRTTAPAKPVSFSQTAKSSIR